MSAEERRSSIDDLGKGVESQSDIPEAARAWALWQKVPDGPPDPSALRNSTTVEPAGGRGPHQGERLASYVAQEGIPAYYAQNADPASWESWTSWCFRGEYDVGNYSSWQVGVVAMPQLVPFVVPKDHPNRSDVSVIIAPGGAGQFLSWEIEGTDVAKWFNLLGISAFVLKYRVPAPIIWKLSSGILDAQRAVSLVKHMAPALGLNASRVGIWGASYGGYIAAWTAFAAGHSYPNRDVVDEQSSRPDFLMMLYPDITAWMWEWRLEHPDTWKPLPEVTIGKLDNLMPIFAAQGADDNCTTVEHLYRFHRVLKKKGATTVEINIYPKIEHGFSLCYRLFKGGWDAMQNEACLWMLRARRFIMWNVEGKVPANVEPWHRTMLTFDTSLLATNSSH